MDGTRFDRIARALGVGLSRRGALGTLAAAGIGAGLGVIRRDAQAACTPAFAPGSDSAENGAKLQAAIDAAPADGVVHLAPGTYDAPAKVADDGVWEVMFRIARPLALVRCGEGEAILRGGMGVGEPEGARAVTVVSTHERGTVRFEGLTVTTGAEDVLNTGIEIRGSKGEAVGEIVDCIVEGNRDSGVLLGDGTFTVSGSTIRGNRDTRWCGGGMTIWVGSGMDTSVTIVDTVIEDNAAWSEAGGSLESWSGIGGGICVRPIDLGIGYAELTLRGTTVRNNVAGPEAADAPDRPGFGSGGGIHVMDASLTIAEGSRIEGNEARAGSACEGTPPSCEEMPGTGGGILYIRTTEPLERPLVLSISADSRVSGNIAESTPAKPGEGGGLQAYFDTKDVTVDIAEGSVSDNFPAPAATPEAGATPVSDATPAAS